MDSRTDVVQFQLPVTWDIALRAVKDAARHGRARLEIHLQGNGYLQLRQARAFRPSITIDITLLAAGTSTTVVATDVTRGIRLSRRERRRVAELIEQLRADAEHFASNPASRGEPANPSPERPPSQAIGEFTRLRGSTLD